MPVAAAGRYFEDFGVGYTYLHVTRKVVSDADIASFTAIPEQFQSRGQNALHGQPQAIHSFFPVHWACHVGIGVLTRGTSLGELKISDVRIKRALCYADTLSAESEVLDLRGADGRSDAGFIEFEVRAYNQRRQLVAKFRCTALVKKRAMGNLISLRPKIARTAGVVGARAVTVLDEISLLLIGSDGTCRASRSSHSDDPLPRS